MFPTFSSNKSFSMVIGSSSTTRGSENPAFLAAFIKSFQYKAPLRHSPQSTWSFCSSCGILCVYWPLQVVHLSYLHQRFLLLHPLIAQRYNNHVHSPNLNPEHVIHPIQKESLGHK